VKASINRIVAEANALRGIGIGTIAIMPNDTDAYPEDSFDNMKAFAGKHNFTFPYAIDTPRKSHAPMTLSAASTRFMASNRSRRAFGTGVIREGIKATSVLQLVLCADRRDRPWAEGAACFHGLFDQVQALS
jgi:hypothetical protein